MHYTPVCTSIVSRHSLELRRSAVRMRTRLQQGRVGERKRSRPVSVSMKYLRSLCTGRERTRMSLSLLLTAVFTVCERGYAQATQLK